MTLEELTHLCEQLMEGSGFSMASLRSDEPVLEWMDDSDFLLAIRFAAGERVEISAPHNTPRGVGRPPARGVPMTDEQWAAIEHEDELDGARFAPDVRGVGDVARAVDLGDGVTLGFDE